MEETMNNPERKEYRKLKTAGFDVNTRPTFTFNAGSHSIKHAFGKLVTAHVGLEEDWRADCEVEGPQGEIDVLWYSPDKLNLALELETNVEEDNVNEKLEKYVYSNDVVDDMHIIEVNDLPAHVFDMKDRIRTELNLY